MISFLENAVIIAGFTIALSHAASAQPDASSKSTAARTMHPAHGKVTGQVVDADGNPVPDVRIDFSALTEPEYVGKAPEINGQRLSQPVQQTGMKRSDSNGNFTIAFPTTGTAVFSTDHKPYVRTLQKVNLPSDNVRITLTTEGGGTATGMVKDLATGQPVPNADVFINLALPVKWWTGDELGTRTYTVTGGRPRIETNESGAYTADRMPSATLQLIAWADSIGPSVPAWASINGAPPLGETQISSGENISLPDIYLYPGYTMQGHVIDAETKAPIAGATVGPSRHTAEILGKPIKPATTDEKGFFELKQVRALLTKPKPDEPSKLFFSSIDATKDGYKEDFQLHNLEERTFDPDNLMIYKDFTLQKGSSGNPTGGFRIGNRKP